ncbi:thiamine pyrophosphate-binding protein [Streptomyces antimycoticus]
MAAPPAHPPTTTVRDAVLALCRATGMTTVFGNPGSTELRMFRDWPEDFRYVLGLQESTAVAMAAGHALGTGGRRWSACTPPGESATPWARCSTPTGTGCRW